MRNYTIISTTNHWTVNGTTFYRTCVIRTEDGELWEADIRDDLIPGDLT